MIFIPFHLKERPVQFSDILVKSFKNGGKFKYEIHSILSSISTDNGNLLFQISYTNLSVHRDKASVKVFHMRVYIYRAYFSEYMNSCYVTWRVDLFWRWKTPPNTTKKYSFSHCCRVRECSTSISFIFWKGERGISCVRCIVLLFDIARSFDMMLVFQFHETGHQLDLHCRLMITNFHYVSLRGNWGWDDLNIDVHNGASGRRCISSDNIDLNDAKYLSIRML